MDHHSVTAKRERKAVAFIRNFTQSRDYAPSVREIAAHIGMSHQGTLNLLNRLVDRGLIWREPGHRNIGVIERDAGKR